MSVHRDVELEATSSTGNHRWIYTEIEGPILKQIDCGYEPLPHLMLYSSLIAHSFL